MNDLNKPLPDLSSKYFKLWLLKRTHGDVEKYVAQISCILLDIPYKIRKTSTKDLMLVELIPNTVKLNMRALDSKNPNAIDQFDKRSIIVTYLTKTMLNNEDSNPDNIIYNNRGQWIPIDFGNLYNNHCHIFLQYLVGRRDYTFILSEINKMVYIVLTHNSSLDPNQTKYVNITSSELKEIIKSLITPEKINKINLLSKKIEKNSELKDDSTLQYIFSNIESINALDKLNNEKEQNSEMDYKAEVNKILKNLYQVREFTQIEKS